MLAVNFHQSFIPERRLINSFLKFSESRKVGTLPKIAAETGIPMGKTTGKAPAIVNYSESMGLVQLTSEKKQKKAPILTPFGEIVLREDPFLGEDITQWIAHINLCRPDIGAKTWNAVFANSSKILGSSFSKIQLEEFLQNNFGSQNNRTGPLIATYTDEAAFKRAHVLEVQDDLVIREKAPITDYFSTSYSAIILELLEEFFPTQSQVTFNDFEGKTSFFEVCFWGKGEIEIVFSSIESRGFISIDRQMKPWIIEKRAIASEVWPLIYNELP